MSEKILQLEDFEPHVGSTFRWLSDKNETVELELIEAVASEMETPEEMRAPFSLIFRGAFPERPVQRMYTLEHESMGKVDGFLVPIGEVEGVFELQAVYA